MRKSILLASAAVFVLTPALAQQSDEATANQAEQHQVEPAQPAARNAARAAETPSFDQTMAADELTDEDFVILAGMSDLFEIEAARIAMERAESDEVRRFAEQLLDEHRQSGRDLASAAQEADVQVAVVNRLQTEAALEIEATGTVRDDEAAETERVQDHEQRGRADLMGDDPAEADPRVGGEDAAEAGEMMEPEVDIGRSSMLDPEHERKLEELRQASAEEFDRRFLELQVEAHEQAISLFERYADEGASEALRDHAEASLETLESHLEEARALEEERS